MLLRTISRGLLLFALLGLAACQAGTPAVAPTALPAAATAAPTRTAAPDPTAAPTPTAAPDPTSLPAPTSAPAAGTLLPAPLYFIGEGGQIWRMEADGASKRQITFEAAPINDFDIAPNDNALAYLIGEADGLTIVLLDAGGRTELISGPVAAPTFSPDGAQLLFQIYTASAGTPTGGESAETTGIFAAARSGGRPNLVLASDPIADPNNPPDDARQYYPVGFSPDGTQLLVGGYYPIGESGFVAIRSMANGALVDIDQGCCEVAWSTDGSAVIVAGGTVVQDAQLGLWRADPHTGASTPLLAPTDTAGSPLVTAARQLADGTIYAFVAVTKEPSIENLDKLAPQRVRPDGTLEPLGDRSYLLADALWADDARGVVIAEATVDQRYDNAALAWLPADGGAPVSLGARGTALHWGQAAAQPTADACARFVPLAWQAPGTRAASPAVAELQRRLLGLGYSAVGTADGLYGDQTRAAVRAFQQASGLPTGGDVDCATWAALLGAG